jgi:hypothetical protein
MNFRIDPARASHVQTGLYLKAEKGLRHRDKRVERLARKMRQVMPWIEDADRPACRAWAELEILAQTVYLALRERGVINEQGDARRLLDDYRKLRVAQIALSRELALTPASRIAIKAGKSESAVDLVALMSVPDAAETVEPESDSDT